MRNRYEVISDSSLIQQHAPLSEWYKWADENHVWVQWRNAALLKMLTDNGLNAVDRLSILDIGCGNGVVMGAFERITNWTFDGVELNEDILSVSSSGRGRLLLYDITTRKEEFKEAYDAVFLLDVIEHIDDPGSFLDAVMFHLKPGGRIVVNLPALQRLMGAYDRAAGHLRRYDRAALVKHFSNSPIEILDIRYWGMCLIPIVYFRKIFLRSETERDKILKRGFAPPNRIAHAAVRLAMLAETRLLPAPPVGASIMMIARKPE